MSTSHWPASLLRKLANKLIDETVNWKKAAALLSTSLLAFATATLTWLRGSFVLRGWWLAAILTYIVILTLIAIIHLQQAIRRSRKFRELRVEQPGVGLEWRLRLDPEDWVHTRLEDYSPGFLPDILVGPFHLPDTGECSAEVGFTINSAGRTLYRPVCSRCQPDEYRECLPDSDPIAQTARTAVAREIQRIFRTGECTHIRKRRVLTLDVAGPTSRLLARKAPTHLDAQANPDFRARSSRLRPLRSPAPPTKNKAP